MMEFETRTRCSAEDRESRRQIMREAEQEQGFSVKDRESLAMGLLAAAKNEKLQANMTVPLASIHGAMS